MIIRNDNITEATLASSVTDPDAYIYVNRIMAIETISQDTAGYINDFFVSLKSAGLFNKIRVMWPMIGTKKESLLLEASGNYKASVSQVGLRWVDLNYRGDGTTSFTSDGMNSNGEWWATNTGPDAPAGYTPYQGLSIVPNINDCHLSAYSRTSRGANGAHAINTDNATINLYYSEYGFYTAIGSSGIQLEERTETKGFFVTSRMSSTDLKAFVDGSLIGSSDVENTNATLSANTPVILPGETIEGCFFSMGLGMTELQVSDFYDIVNELQTKLGRAN